MVNTSYVISAMINYYAGDAKRINHFIKVFGFAKTIGELEGIDKRTQQILEVAAITHDIGIKNSEMKYNSAAGCYQQTEGPPEARKMLEKLEFDPELIERVCRLIARHHTYDDIVDMDCQILIEADFIVNAYEDDLSADAVRSIKKTIFRTSSGKSLLDEIYHLQ